MNCEIQSYMSVSFVYIHLLLVLGDRLAPETARQPLFQPILDNCGIQINL